MKSRTAPVAFQAWIDSVRETYESGFDETARATDGGPSSAQ
jgi:hypothetical protein